MKFDFDTYEFAALIAPGGVAVVVIGLVYPQLLHQADAAILIAAGLFVAYILGHLIAAVGNIAGPLFDLLPTPHLEAIVSTDWKNRGYVSAGQMDQLGKFTEDDANLRGINAHTRRERKIAVRQMYLRIMRAEHLKRLETFNGLYNLSRGLVIAFAFGLILSLIVRRYDASAFFGIAAVLAVFRTSKFSGIYATELAQQFLVAQMCSKQETNS